MLAYLASKEQFLKDAPTIEDIVKTAVKNKLNLSVGNSEYQAWRNSLGNAMLLPAHLPNAIHTELNAWDVPAM